MEWVKGTDKQEYIDELLKSGFVDSGITAIIDVDDVKYYEQLETTFYHPQFHIFVDIYTKHATVRTTKAYLGKEYFEQ